MNIDGFHLSICQTVLSDMRSSVTELDMRNFKKQTCKKAKDLWMNRELNPGPLPRHVNYAKEASYP